MAARTQSRKLKEATREILYPEVNVRICFGDNKLTATKAAEYLAWESEKQYAERTGKKEPFGDNFLLKDTFGNKIRCWNNSSNRPFKKSWAEALAQDILHKKWRKNLENIIIGKTGKVLSGQHRLIALILAVQMWGGKQKNHWQAIWDEEPYIETLVAVGADEDPDTLASFDQTMPRGLSDVIYTSEIFSHLNPIEKKECSRMLQVAVDFLWKRTGANRDPFQRYETNSAGMDFVSRHPRLVKCVKHIHELNNPNGRAISGLDLSPGLASGMLYLMGSDTSDGDVYRNNIPPTEKKLHWGHWDEACEFWSLLAKTGSKPVPKEVAKFLPIRTALGGLVDPDSGKGGRETEKCIVILKAWHLHQDNQKITQSIIMPKYAEDEDGKRVLVEDPTFEGIDIGSGKKHEAGTELSPEQIEAAKKAERERRSKELQERIKNRKNGNNKQPPSAEGIKPLSSKKAGQEEEEE